MQFIIINFRVETYFIFHHMIHFFFLLTFRFFCEFSRLGKSSEMLARSMNAQQKCVERKEQFSKCLQKRTENTRLVMASMMTCPLSERTIRSTNNKLGLLCRKAYTRASVRRRHGPMAQTTR